MKKYLLVIFNIIAILDIIFDYYVLNMEVVPYVIIGFILMHLVCCLYQKNIFSLLSALVCVLGYSSFYVVNIFSLNKYSIIIPICSFLISTILFVASIYKKDNKMASLPYIINMPIVSYLIIMILLPVVIQKCLNGIKLSVIVYIIIILYFMYRVIKKYIMVKNKLRDVFIDVFLSLVLFGIVCLLIIIFKEKDKVVLFTIFDYFILLPFILRIYFNSKNHLNFNYDINNFNFNNEDNLLEDNSVIDADFEIKD